MPNQPFLCHFIDAVEDVRVKDSLGDILSQRCINIENPSLRKKVLILASDYDPEANLVGIGLRNKGIDYVRLNIDDVPHRIKVRYSIGPRSDLAVEFTIQNQLYVTSALSVVWLRNFDIHDKDFDFAEPGTTFSRQQWNSAFEILNKNLSCEWISNPQATLHANDRTKQLSVAKTIGFDIPNTLITNDPDAAREFYFSYDGKVVIKALRHHSVVVQSKMYSMFTHRILERDLSNLRDLIYAPCILQEQVFEKSELRVTVVGDDVFAAELDPQYTENNYDSLQHNMPSNFLIKVFDLPDRIRTRCINLVRSLGLRYGAIDFIRDDQERLVFLEVNPTGDWYWIESRTNLSITEAMVNLIERLHRSGTS